MGGNGSFASGGTREEAGRKWKTIYVMDNGVKIIELKDANASIKLPEESHSPNTTYAIFYKGDKGLKSLATYGADGKKIFEIHTADHRGLGPHYHQWENGRPLEAKPLTSEMKELLKKVNNLTK